MAVIIIWEILSRSGVVRTNVLPAPTAVAAAFWKLFVSGRLIENILVSAGRASVGFAIGGTIGFALGLANGLSLRSRSFTDTTLQMIRNVPHLALIPLVILWFGIGEEAKIFLVALGVFFPVYVNTLLGIQTVDPQLVEMARTYGVRHLDLFRRVILPGALPSIFVGIRYALGIMWLTHCSASLPIQWRACSSGSRSSGIRHSRGHDMTDLAINSRGMAFRDATSGEVSSRRTSGVGFTVAGLEKRFGDKQVLRGIDLNVPAGQFLAIIGKSGCGKSTLLRLLAGLDTPTGGTIGTPGSAYRQTTRIMFQEPRLLPWARIRQNVAVGLTGIAGQSETAGRADAILAEVGLADRAGDWPSVLSGGQRQRVALARALVSQPRILALDEPLGALDALTRIEMQALLERIWLHQKFTAVLVTHDVSEALTLADRIVVIDGGRIALDREVALPRPRRRGAIEIARLEGEILDHLFNGAAP